MAWQTPGSGQLRERIRIERRGAVDDGYGNLAGAWATVAQGIAARITPTRGSEEVQANRLVGLGTYDITIRAAEIAATGLASDDRIVDERSGRTFNLKWSGCLDERQRFLVLLCEAGGAE